MRTAVWGLRRRRNRRQGETGAPAPRGRARVGPGTASRRYPVHCRQNSSRVSVRTPRAGSATTTDPFRTRCRTRKCPRPSSVFTCAMAGRGTWGKASYGPLTPLAENPSFSAALRSPSRFVPIRSVPARSRICSSPMGLRWWSATVASAAAPQSDISFCRTQTYFRNTASAPWPGPRASSTEGTRRGKSFEKGMGYGATVPQWTGLECPQAEPRCRGQRLTRGPERLGRQTGHETGGPSTYWDRQPVDRVRRDSSRPSRPAGNGDRPPCPPAATIGSPAEDDTRADHPRPGVATGRPAWRVGNQHRQNAGSHAPRTGVRSGKPQSVGPARRGQEPVP